jgi:hypothetical protein
VTPSIPELIGDIRDCASRARDLGHEHTAADLESVAQALEYAERASSLAANREARETATGRFRAARAILRGVLT